jgi:hypothetical protein
LRIATRNFRSSFCIFAFLIFSILIQNIDTKSVNKDIFGSDEGGYYNYLPALIIYQDLHFNYIESQSDYRKSFLNKSVNKDGEEFLLNRYSTGPAILQLPFFGIACIHSYFQTGTMTGFEPVFRFWIFAGLLFYIALSFFLLQHILSRYFDDLVIAFTILITGLGTNLFYYVNYEPLMSHSYSFFLYSLSLFLTIKWLEDKQWKTMIFLGFTFGLLAVTRLPDVVFIIVLLLWGTDSFSLLKERFLLLYKYHKALIFAFIFFLIPFVPQMFYWHSVSGYWFIDPYAATGARFFFDDPFVSEVLIGYKKGWLLYSPLMIFSLTGFVFLYKKARNIFPGILLFTMLNIYIVSCWSYWWYGGSFGMRALIESMLPLAFCVAATIDYFFRYRIKKVMMISLIITGIGFNLLQTHQYTQGLIHSFGMTRNSYWASFAKLPPLSERDYKVFDKYLLGVYMNEMTAKARAETATYNERSEKQ